MNKEIEAVKKIQAGYKPSLSFSKPLDGAKLRVLSLGAGVQSSVLALMAARREIGPRPDVMIFADTGFEPKKVYTHLKWLTDEIKRLTNGQVKVLQVSAGNIKDDHLAGRNSTGQQFAGIPFFTQSGGMGRRQCTSEYKIQPVTKKLRELLGLKYRQHAPKVPTVELWMGISTDEVQRMKESQHKWLKHRWPLIEEQMSRQDCLAWFNKEYPTRRLAKSACIVCPFHSNEGWRRLRDETPDEWQEAVDFDAAIRHGGTKLKGMKEQQYAHRSCVPLDEVDLSTAADKGQAEFGFLEECEGMCGV